MRKDDVINGIRRAGATPPGEPSLWSFYDPFGQVSEVRGWLYRYAEKEIKSAIYPQVQLWEVSSMAEILFRQLRDIFPQISEQTKVHPMPFTRLVIPVQIQENPVTLYSKLDLPGARARVWRALGELFAKPKWIAKGREVVTSESTQTTVVEFSAKGFALEMNYQKIMLYGFYEPVNDVFYCRQISAKVPDHVQR